MLAWSEIQWASLLRMPIRIHPPGTAKEGGDEERYVGTSDTESKVRGGVYRTWGLGEWEQKEKWESNKEKRRALTENIWPLLQEPCFQWQPQQGWREGKDGLREAGGGGGEQVHFALKGRRDWERKRRWKLRTDCKLGNVRRGQGTWTDREPDAWPCVASALTRPKRLPLLSQGPLFSVHFGYKQRT